MITPMGKATKNDGPETHFNVTKINAESGSFDFLKDETEIYTKDDLKIPYPQAKKLAKKRLD